MIKNLKFLIEENSPPLSYSIKDLNLLMHTISKFKEHDQKRIVSAKFEWVTGLLIKAIERGEWVVLENANLCNPTVLDRINSLVEPCGSITVNERGIVDGNPLVIHPHPNFRMFLTVNPRYGEVSRAMRNRGVEKFMMQPDWALDDRSGSNYENIEFKYVKRFIILSGIPISQLVDSMASAHIYAKSEGSKLNVHITYLELSHWVNLFLELLMNGSHLIWSLQLSWENVYLSSLGVEGEQVINFAKTTYLSVIDLSGYDSLVACPLPLPGGWPMPLRLRDYILYSKEASIKQNCLYLEFLGTQLASNQFQVALKRYSRASLQATSDHVKASMMDVRTLRDIMFPKALAGVIPHHDREYEYDSELTSKMLLFAANWTIEQATKSDFKLYLHRFKWFSSQLQHFCQFFDNFHMLIEQMMKHPIWDYISCRSNLDAELQLMPLLSIDFAATNNEIKYLCNAIRCIDMLRLTYQQWITEGRLNNQQWITELQDSLKDEASCFLPVLNSLFKLEDVFLKKLVNVSKDRSFDDKFQLYSDLIEDHVLFWRHISSSKYDQMIIVWHSLVKNAGKFMEICPEAVNHFLMESKRSDRFSRLERSLLWIHGGHPFLPSSSDMVDKYDLILNFVETHWPRKRACNQGVLSSHLVDVVASFDHNLRFLVMQGVSNSSFMIAKQSNEDDGVDIITKLEEVNQVLLSRFEDEKNKLQMSTGSIDLSDFAERLASCCSSAPEMLCQKSVLEGWQDTFPPADNTSLFLDLQLLKKLTSMPLDDLEGLPQDVERLSYFLDFALKFSLNFSSRPPQMFSPHQKILWTLNSMSSMDAGDTVDCSGREDFKLYSGDVV